MLSGIRLSWGEFCTANCETIDFGVEEGLGIGTLSVVSFLYQYFCSCFAFSMIWHLSGQAISVVIQQTKESLGGMILYSSGLELVRVEF